MDELGRILERAATGRTAFVLVPPASVIINLSRRRTTIRLIASSAVVLVMVVAFILVLAGVGLASSDTAHPLGPLATASVAVR